MKKNINLIFYIFINYLIQDGKKEKAFFLFLSIIKELNNYKKTLKKSPIEILYFAVLNISPIFIVNKIPVKTKKVPILDFRISLLNEYDSLRTGIKILIQQAFVRKNENSLVLKLRNEIIDSYLKKSISFKEKLITHKHVIKNKALFLNNMFHGIKQENKKNYQMLQSSTELKDIMKNKHPVLLKKKDNV